VHGVDPDGSLDDAADLQRSITLAKSMEGRVYLRGWLDPVGGEYVHSALAAAMNGDRPAGDTRTFAERQADALVLLARDALASDRLPDVRGERPQIRVGIDLMALCAERAAPGVAGGELGFAGPITPETARRLACDASVVRIITGPDGLPLDVGRAQRTATTTIRRSLEARDGHCIFTGCDAPPEWCDVGLPRFRGHDDSGHHRPRKGCPRDQGFLAGVQGSDRRVAPRWPNRGGHRGGVRPLGDHGEQLGARR
jgi:hypothetical protein